jgi:hypothetical protein
VAKATIGVKELVIIIITILFGILLFAIVKILMGRMLK